MQNKANDTVADNRPGYGGRDWYWCCNSEQYLVLVLGKGIVYTTNVSVNKLTESFANQVPFSTTDAQVFQEFSQYFGKLGFAEEGRFRLAIAATIGQNYLIPLPTRSWYFKLADGGFSQHYRTKQLIQLKAQTDGIYVILSTDGAAANVMLLNPQHAVNNVKQFGRGAILKVHTDRFEPLNKPFQVSDL